MNNTKILAAAARRWPQELQEPAFREWCAELAAMDYSAPDTLRNRWLKYRFVWSLLMSKPPQTGATRSARRIPKNVRSVLYLCGIGVVLGVVMPLAGTVAMMDGEFGSTSILGSVLLAAVIVSVAAVTFRFGMRSNMTGGISSTVVVVSVMLGGVSSLVLLGAVGYLLLVPLLAAYYAALVLIVLGLDRGLRELVQRGRRFWAWPLGAVGLYLTLGLISAHVPFFAGRDTVDFGVLLKFGVWDIASYNAMISLVLAALVPIMTLTMGRAMRKEPAPIHTPAESPAAS